MGLMTKLGVIVILLAVVSTGLSLFVGGFVKDYPTTMTGVSTKNFSYFEKSASVLDMSKDVVGSMEEQDTSSVSVFDIPFMAVTSAFRSLKMLLGMGDLAFSLFTGIDLMFMSVNIDASWAFAIVFILIAFLVGIWILAVIIKIPASEV